MIYQHGDNPNMTRSAPSGEVCVGLVQSTPTMGHQNIRETPWWLSSCSAINCRLLRHFGALHGYSPGLLMLSSTLKAL